MRIYLFFGGYTPNPGEINKLYTQIDQKFARAAGRVRDRARLNIDKLGRVDTGAMKQRIETHRDGQLRYSVTATTFYAPYQELGTQAHGPRTARVLHWTSKSGQSIFARRVKGIKAGNFMKDAVNSLTEADFR